MQHTHTAVIYLSTVPDIIGDLLLHCLYCKINMGN